MSRSSRKRRMPANLVLATGFLAAAVLWLAPAATAAVPYKDISSSGPLQNVYLGNELSCQIRYAGDDALQFFPSSAIPGDCGTFLAVGGSLYAPDFAQHDGTATSGLGSYTPFTPVSQSDVSGAGTRSDPYRVTTTVDVGGTGLRITETTSYVAGEEAYRTDTTVRNPGGSAQEAVLYHAGDCFLQESDSGFGFVQIDGDGASPGCALNANNNPPARIEQFVAITGGNQYYEAGYSEVWAAIATHATFPNTCARCDENIDNGAGISWNITVPAGGEVTRSRYTTFSPQGRTGAPPEMVTPEEIGLPSARRCVDRRKFSFDLRRRSGRRVVRVEVYVKRGRSRRGLGRLKQVRTGRNIVRLNIRRLPPRRFKVTIRTTHHDGSRLESWRVYRACSKSKPRTRTIR
jgi:hypothetical protein